MRRIELALLAFALVGCELTATVGHVPLELGEGELGSTDAPETDSTESSSESESGTGESSSGETDSSESSSEADSSGSTSDSEGPMTTDSSPTGPDGCGFEPGDDFCEVCLDDFCCMEQDFCTQSFSCQCMLDCVVDLPPPECAMQCQPGFEYFALLQCRDAACTGVCM
ncbi:hypothetical protein ACNOYE_10040 [Nannocystaceae bacterium ST9]